MALQLKGQNLVLTSGGQLNTDRFGLSAATAKWWYYGDDPEGQISLRAEHPRWAFMHCDRQTITRRSDGAWDIEATYFGVDGTPDEIYGLDGSLCAEPIETHPYFDQFAPFSTNPTSGTGATFESDGAFKEFVKLPKSNAAATNPAWIGVRDYLSAGVVWWETSVRMARPTDLSQLGYIDDSVPGSPPSFTGRNWLFSDCRWEEKGKTFVIRKEWRLSGLRGWNQTLYKKPYALVLV